MRKVVACLTVRTPKAFTWLGHMPILNWSLTQLIEVRGITRIVCVTDANLKARAEKLLAKDTITVSSIPKALTNAKEAELDAWLTSASGPACDADVVITVKPVNPFLPAAKVEACLDHVLKGKSTTCIPVRNVTAMIADARKKLPVKEVIAGLRVFRVAVPVEKALYHGVPVNLMESLDVENHDHFVLAAAMIDSNKI